MQDIARMNFESVSLKDTTLFNNLSGVTGGLCPLYLPHIATIKNVLNPLNYKKKFGDGSTRIVHIQFIWRYHQQRWILCSFANNWSYYDIGPFFSFGCFIAGRWVLERAGCNSSLGRNSNILLLLTLHRFADLRDWDISPRLIKAMARGVNNCSSQTFHVINISMWNIW